MKVWAVLLAAGRGERFGGTENKIFRQIGARSVLERSVAVFANHSKIDGLLIVAGHDDADRVERLMREAFPDQNIPVVNGGKTRQESALMGLLAVREKWIRDRHVQVERSIVLLHDAARCLVSPELITAMIHVIAEQHCGAAPAIPVTDTIRLTDEDGRTVRKTLPRRRLVAMQTPQGADFDVMLRAASIAAEAETESGVTDDIELLMRIGYPVKLIKGEKNNIKITTPGDLLIAKAIIGGELDK